MKVYLSARFSRAADCESAAVLIRAAGHEVTSRWHDPLHNHDHRWDDKDPRQAARLAQIDCEDIERCDLLVFFNDTPDSNGQRGGRHVEFGIAFAHGKLCVILGEPCNVFHFLPGVALARDLRRVIQICDELNVVTQDDDAADDEELDETAELVPVIHTERQVPVTEG